MHAREAGGTQQERTGVHREGPARAGAQDERGREGRSGEFGDVVRHRRHGRRLLDVRLGHGLRQEAVGGRPKEGLGAAEEHLDDHDLPDLHGAGEDQPGEQRVQREAHEVGRDHHALARQAIRPDAPDEHEGDQWQRGRREHQPQVGRAAGAADHEQRQCDDHDVVAYHAGGLREPQEPEVAVPEQPPDLAEAVHRLPA